LTVVLAILILAILTAAALAALHWFQKRAELTPPVSEKIYSSMYNDLTPVPNDLDG
jgi:phage-related protein